MKRIYIIPVVLAALSLMASCVRKDLVMENNVVDLTLKVEDGGEGLFRGLVWDMSSDNVLTTVFVNPGMSKVTIPAGHSGLVVHTFGCEATYISEESSFGGVMATTNEADVLSQDLWASVVKADNMYSPVERARIEGLKVRWEPDRMWAGHFDAVLPHRGEGETLEMEVQARPVFRGRQVVLRDVEGLEFIASAEAFVVGCAEGYRIADGAPVGDCAVRVPMYRYKGGLIASYLTFGESADTLTPKMLLVMVTDTGGRRFLSRYDLDGVFADVDVMDVPSGMAFEQPPVVEGGGLQPTLQDWNEVVTPVEV